MMQPMKSPLIDPGVTAILLQLGNINEQQFNIQIWVLSIFFKCFIGEFLNLGF